MSTTTTTPPTVLGSDMRSVAHEMGPELALHAARHDRDGTFVQEAFDVLRERGYLASPVPTELGGGGATTEEVAWAQYELARWCGSSALATTMHLHVVLANAWRLRRGQEDAAVMLRRVADEAVFVASTGGGDFTVPTAMATKVDGGWEVSGRKSFVSGAPVATLASTWACTDEGGAIGFGLPLAAPGVEIVESWDAPGMRGTASHDVVFDRVLVRDAQVTAQRTPGEFAPVLAILAAKALMVIAATYLGIARGARDEVVARVRESGKDADVGLQRTIGAMDEQLLAAESVLRITLLDLGDDPDPSVDTFVTAMLAKRTIIESARAIGDLAMDALGGRAYRRGDPVERAWRDLRAGPFHPLEHELVLRVAGQHALGEAITLR
jgi:alkylation response protein AidB-like acyl-CoA dehydrogenase